MISPTVGAGADNWERYKTWNLAVPKTHFSHDLIGFRWIFVFHSIHQVFTFIQIVFYVKCVKIKVSRAIFKKVCKHLKLW